MQTKRNEGKNIYETIFISIEISLLKILFIQILMKVKLHKVNCLLMFLSHNFFIKNLLHNRYLMETVN